MNIQFTILFQGKPLQGKFRAYIASADLSTIYQDEGLIYNPVSFTDLELEKDNNNAGLVVNANGVNTFFSFAYLYNQATKGNTKIEMDLNYSPFPYLLVGAGLLLFMFNDNDKHKVGAISKDKLQTSLIVTGGIIGWIIVKKILEILGILDDRDEVDLNNAANDPNSFWNPLMWNNKPSNIRYTEPIVTQQQAQYYASLIYDAMGFFNDNEEQVIAVFRAMPSQAAASYVNYWFNQLYKQDLLTFLRGGTWPQDRLSDSEVNQINQYVKNLPKY